MYIIYGIAVTAADRGGNDVPEVTSPFNESSYSAGAHHPTVRLGLMTR